MAHTVWLEHALVESVAHLSDLVAPYDIRVTVDTPAHAPDVIVTTWRGGTPPWPSGAEWPEALPSAHLFLARPDQLAALLESLARDPLMDAVLVPAGPADLALGIARALARREQYLNLTSRTLHSPDAGETPSGLVGESPLLRQVIARAHQVASSPATNVLIQGESGTGKELLARLIHAQTPNRRHHRFVDLNCAAIPADLLEAELFGFDRGAFTNASRDKAGLMEMAHGGTLFLDEIGELNVGLQAKLLRVLETGAFRRLGGVSERRSDCRVIASTNRNLLDAVQSGLFRLDLYHRLAVLTLQTPPLRERREDIMPIANFFLARLSSTMARPAAGFSPTAQALLMGYPYPGNVRELRNIVERALILTETPLITPKALGLELALMADTAPPARTAFGAHPPATGGPAAPTAPWHQSLAERERQHVEQALAGARGNRTLAARVLGISVPTLYKKIRKYQLESIGR